MLSVSVVSPPPGSSPVKRINYNDYDYYDEDDYDGYDDYAELQNVKYFTQINSFEMNLPQEKARIS